jgi:hypothetical protein
MSSLLDLFQWERFVTPTIIKLFYALVVLIVVLYGGASILSSIPAVLLNPLTGLFVILGNLLGMLVAIVFARIFSEFVLVMFRINEHLGHIRSRGGM